MPFPDYDNPPVIETILGVQFERLPGFKNGHLGAFWKTLGSEEWPTVSDAPPLAPQFERFTESAKWAKLGLMLSEDPSTRLQIKNKNGDRMIQVQNGRLHFNWLQQPGRAYPRYETVRDGFLEAWRKFTAFLGEEKLGDLRPNQWEVTYLNHIPKGTVWRTPEDWGFFRPLNGASTVAGIAQGESFGGIWHFVIPEQRGRLHVEWQHGVQPGPGKEEMVVLTLTARGPLEVGSAEIRTILAGLNLGREAIVRSFAKLMTNEANKYWGLKHAGN